MNTLLMSFQFIIISHYARHKAIQNNCNRASIRKRLYIASIRVDGKVRLSKYKVMLLQQLLLFIIAFPMILKGLLNGNDEHLLLVLLSTLSYNGFGKNNELFTFKFLNSFLKSKIKGRQKIQSPLLGYHFFSSVLHPSLASLFRAT